MDGHKSQENFKRKEEDLRSLPGKAEMGEIPG